MEQNYYKILAFLVFVNNALNEFRVEYVLLKTSRCLVKCDWLLSTTDEANKEVPGSATRLLWKKRTPAG